MKKLIGLKKTRSAVFISGTGSNLKNIIKFSKKKNSPISIAMQNAYQQAKQAGDTKDMQDAMKRLVRSEHADKVVKVVGASIPLTG